MDWKEESEGRGVESQGYGFAAEPCSALHVKRKAQFSGIARRNAAPADMHP